MIMGIIWFIIIAFVILFFISWCINWIAPYFDLGTSIKIFLIMIPVATLWVALLAFLWNGILSLVRRYTTPPSTPHEPVVKLVESSETEPGAQATDNVVYIPPSKLRRHRRMDRS